MITVDCDYFRALETPRMAALAPNLVAAVFPLMKLMPARYILDRAAADGEIKPGARIVETTSGTFGMALALLAAARGYELTLITASSLIDAKYAARLERIGAIVITVEDPSGNGDQLGRLQRLEMLLATAIRQPRKLAGLCQADRTAGSRGRQSRLPCRLRWKRRLALRDRNVSARDFSAPGHFGGRHAPQHPVRATSR